MVDLSKSNELERTSTINKAKSPVVENNYKARAQRVTKDEVTSKQSEGQVQIGPGQPKWKVTKSEGLGRHRSTTGAQSGDVRDDVSTHTNRTKSSDKAVSFENTATVEDNEEVPPAPLCGLCM
mmetsp:Transcript_3712/g.4558  ORF Transcript_3712/g.4558 Transcript_3712/m.4558 type:complete len:123 (-) Transcript_3712:234-602(-)